MAQRRTSPDEETLLDAFDQQPIIKSPIFGEFCLNDIDMVQGKAPDGDSGQQKVKLSDLQGAFKNAGEEEIQAGLSEFAGFLSELDGIKQLYRDKGRERCKFGPSATAAKAETRNQYGYGISGHRKRKYCRC